MPIDEYYNLFLGVGTAVSLFLIVQHVGNVCIRYLNHHQNRIAKNKARKEILDETRNGRLCLNTSLR
jgi:hypothetical protein